MSDESGDLPPTTGLNARRPTLNRRRTASGRALLFVAPLRHAGPQHPLPARVRAVRKCFDATRSRGCVERSRQARRCTVHAPFATSAAKPRRPAFLPAAHPVPPHRQERKKKRGTATTPFPTHPIRRNPDLHPHQRDHLHVHYTYIYTYISCTHSLHTYIYHRQPNNRQIPEKQIFMSPARPRRIIPTHAGMHLHASVRRRRLVSSMCVCMYACMYTACNSEDVSM